MASKPDGGGYYWLWGIIIGTFAGLYSALCSAAEVIMQIAIAAWPRATSLF